MAKMFELKPHNVKSNVEENRGEAKILPIGLENDMDLITPDLELLVSSMTEIIQSIKNNSASPVSVEDRKKLLEKTQVLIAFDDSSVETFLKSKYDTNLQKFENESLSDLVQVGVNKTVEELKNDPNFTIALFLTIFKKEKEEREHK